MMKRQCRKGGNEGEWLLNFLPVKGKTELLEEGSRVAQIEMNKIPKGRKEKCGKFCTEEVVGVDESEMGWW
jgi:hypothetical protein